MRKKISFLKVFALIIVISLLSACASKTSMDMLPSDGDKGDIMTGGNIEYDQEKADSLADPEDKKVISNYFLTLESLDFEKTRGELNTLIEENKSYIESSNIGFRGYDYSKNYRYGDLTIRIPKENIEKFKMGLEKIGNLTQESTDTQDVTKFYRDTESRLKLVTAKEKRLLELLDKAVKIEDIIAIESELTNTIYEKEMLEKDLKSVDERIEYSSLNLQIVEVRSFSNTDRVDSSLLLRLKSAFKDSLFAFRMAVENFIVWLVFAIPYIVIITILALLGLVFIKKRKNKKI